MREKQAGAALAVVLAVGVLGASGMTAAYLSHIPKELVNVFSTGSVGVQVKEENWNPDKNGPIHPGQVVEKDPVAENTGDQAAWVFLNVEIPMDNIRIVDPGTKKKLERQIREIFTFQADEENWELVAAEKIGDKARYVYGFKRLLEPGEKTSPLFSQVKAVNFLDGEMDKGRNYEILVHGRALQSGVEKETIQEIYQELLKQEEADRKGENL